MWFCCCTSAGRSFRHLLALSEHPAAAAAAAAPLQDAPDGPWSLKDKAGFIQTPQDFWNVDAADPLVHSARFFYGAHHSCCYICGLHCRTRGALLAAYQAHNIAHATYFLQHRAQRRVTYLPVLLAHKTSSSSVCLAHCARCCMSYHMSPAAPVLCSVAFAAGWRRHRRLPLLLLHLCCVLLHLRLRQPSIVNIK
jgi:hypothetical protein